MAAELERTPQPDSTVAALLRENTYGIVNADALTTEEKLLGLASLVPMALEVVDEARDTIMRLRAENDRLRAALPSG